MCTVLGLLSVVLGVGFGFFGSKFWPRLCGRVLYVESIGGYFFFGSYHIQIHGGNSGMLRVWTWGIEHSTQPLKPLKSPEGVGFRGQRSGVQGVGACAGS